MADLGLLAGTGLAFAIAWIVARAVFPAHATLERALATFAGLAIVVLPLSTFLAALGLLKTGYVLGGLVALMGLALFATRKLKARDAQTDVEPAERFDPYATFGTAGLALALAAPMVDRLLLKAWEPHWDDATYHAPMAARWLQEARLILAPSNYHAYFPGNGELFAAFFMLPSKLEAYANLAGFYWLVLAALAVASIARALGASVPSATLCAAAVWTSEPFIHQATSFAAVDLAVAASMATAIAFALRAVRDEGAGLARVLYVGCLSGLATGAKITAAPIGVLALLWMLAQTRPSMRRALGQLAGFGAALLLCGGYWYARNAWISGNPIFPAKLGFLDGPLTASVREPTTLVFQLAHASERERAQAIEELLAWPRPLGLAVLAGYALTLLSALRPKLVWRAWSQPALVWIAGVSMLLLAVTGPFSGSTNSFSPSLNVRVRFVLGFVLLGVPLIVSLLDRLPRARPWTSYAMALGLALMSPVPLQAVLACAALGALLAGTAAAFVRLWRERPNAQRIAVVAGLCWLAPLLAIGAVSLVKAPRQEAERMRGLTWTALDRLPYGARITWFSSYEQQRYFPLFRSRLRIRPIAVEEDGRRYTFLHEVWDAPLITESKDKLNWRRRIKKGRSWEWPATRTIEREKAVTNLRAQGIDYVLFLKRSRDEWHKLYPYFSAVPGVRLLARKSTFALYALKGERPHKPRKRS